MYVDIYIYDTKTRWILGILVMEEWMTGCGVVAELIGRSLRVEVIYPPENEDSQHGPFIDDVPVPVWP